MPDQITTPRVVVSGLGSGAGKTTVSLGLIGALRRRNRTVQPFKLGASPIDAAYLAHVAQRPCRSLDSWILGSDELIRCMAAGATDADIAIVDGSGGIFDGHGALEVASDGAQFPGSAAELAHRLGAPVILVVDTNGMSQTVAALVRGVRAVDPSLDVAGVILANVGSEQRGALMEDAVWRLAHTPVLGVLPRVPGTILPETRAELRPLAQQEGIDEVLTQLAMTVERHCDIGLIERIAARARPLPVTHHASRSAATTARIAVAYDDAFCLVEPENLEALEAAGAQVIPVSPLDDHSLPREIDALYIAGGVVEKLLPKLSRNRAFMEAVTRAHAHGVAVFAESGGMLWIAEDVTTPSGEVHRMAGLIPASIRLLEGRTPRRYREITLADDTPIGPRGLNVRGHEFHEMQVVPRGNARHAYRAHDADGQPLGCDGWLTPRLIASAVSIHLGQDPELARRFVEFARHQRSEVPLGA